MSKKKKQNSKGGRGTAAESGEKNADDASSYARDAFMTNPIASATDATGFAQRIPETAAEAESLSEMFDLENDVTEKKGRH